jgi:FMN phosphatase YigB (HAD superfamily)
VTLDPASFDAVLFDAGGVLLLPDPTVIGPLLAPYGGSVAFADHHRAHYAAIRALDDEGPEGWRRYNTAYVRSVGVPPEDEDEAAEMFGAARPPGLWRYPIPGAVEVLRALHAAGVPIGVVSNANGQIERALLRAGICQVGAGDGAPVLCVVDSHVVGVMKPDPRIFDGAVAALGVAHDRVAYVGDSVRYDVDGAAAAGLVPVLLDPYDDHAGEPHTRIASLRDLVRDSSLS